MEVATTDFSCVGANPRPTSTPLLDGCEVPSYSEPVAQFNSLFAPNTIRPPHSGIALGFPFGLCISHLANALSTASFGGIILTRSARLHILALVESGIAHLAAPRACDAELAGHLRIERPS